MKIIRNAIRCELCGEVIESVHRHDHVRCSCGACAVDGGTDYLRRCFREKGCYTELSVTQDAPPPEETAGKEAAPQRPAGLAPGQSITLVRGAVPGAGGETAVKATVHAGTLCVGDRLVLIDAWQPEKPQLQVTGMEKHRLPVQRAVSGDRILLKLAGDAAQLLAGGVLLVSAAFYEGLQEAYGEV